jgi:microsomal epoxide hydrolase
VQPRPFRVDIPQAALDDLRERLDRTRWPGPPPAPGWTYGLDQHWLRGICAYWRDGYDWRHWERRLNEIPQFLVAIDGVDIHFLHIRSPHPEATPLLLMHGWPGSVIEFLHVVGPLADPVAYGGEATDAFHLVIPSLPGFGFSGQPQEQGWGVGRIGRAFDTLMREVLGYTRYAIQGGDFGAAVGIQVARAYPDHLLAIHLNYVLVEPPPADEMDEADRAALRWRENFVARHTSHRNVQGTVPDSLTLAQGDSPAGLAAWILSKMNVLCDGGVESAFDRDLLITNLMLYWLPGCVASAARLYAETRNDPLVLGGRVEVPTAVAAFPVDTWKAPRNWVEPHYNLVRWTEMRRGGHFPALEQPEL